MCRVLRIHASTNHWHPHGTKLRPLLADFFVYSYKVELKQTLNKDERIAEANVINLTFRYSACWWYSVN